MIYLDNASTTKIEKYALEIYDYFSEVDFFNASAVYAINNTKALSHAREVISSKLGFNSQQNVIFTASASEANNLAFTSASNDFVISMGEHPSVYNTAFQLSQTKRVQFCPLNNNGEIDYDAFEQILSENTKFISIIHVNNETGAINDIDRIVQIKDKICKDAILHVDGVQAFCKIDFNMKQSGVDLYTVSAHKIGGPKGVGALIFKDKKKLKPIIYGGGQEFNLRSGTENLPAIMAFAKVVEQRKSNLKFIEQLKETFLSQLKDLTVAVNCDNSSPYILSLSFLGVRGETLVSMLKDNNVYISTGSACSSKKMGNRVLDSMGYDGTRIISSVRISFFESNTVEEVKKAGEIVKKTYLDLKEKMNV